MSDKEKKVEVETGFVEVTFDKDFGSHKKGDTETYHVSTAKALVERKKVAKITKVLKKYVPKKAAI